MLRRAITLVGGGLVYSAGIVATLVYMAEDGSVIEMSHEERSKVYSKNAANYDQGIDRDEAMTGIKLMRYFLMKNATGNVLEVAAGTGRNLKYYSSDCDLTLADTNEEMLKCIPKVDRNVIKTVNMNSNELHYPNGSFDTVVDTFGLCSFDDPVESLCEMQRVCKPNGQILLLEHGRSNYSFVNYVLDKFAEKHSKKWGCIWNRNIAEILEKSGLQLVTYKTYHFGTSHYIIAKPKRMQE